MPLMGLSSLSSSYPGSAKHRHIQKEDRSTDAIDYLCACLELAMLMMMLMMIIYTANEIVPPASSLATWYWKYITTRSGTSAVVDTVPEVV